MKERGGKEMMKFFKNPIVIVIEVLFVCFMWYRIGLSEGKNSQDPMKTTVADIIAESVDQMMITYNNGFDV